MAQPAHRNIERAMAVQIHSGAVVLDGDLILELGSMVGEVISRGGRPDPAGGALSRVESPTLLIVGGLDYPVIEMNQIAYERLRCEKELKIIAGATHLFEEPGKLEQVATLAADWFKRFLTEGEKRQ